VLAKATALTSIAAAAEGVTVIVSAPELVSYKYQTSSSTLAPFWIAVRFVKLVDPIFTVLTV